MSDNLAVLVDGSGFAYRAYYALPQLTNGAEQPVGAVYGFCSMLIPLLEKHRADLFCVVMDSGRDTFRKEVYAEYKSNRKVTPDDLKSQMPLLREACEAFGVPIISKKGFEADDVIATCATELSERGYKVRIISSDKDLTQLISDSVSLFDPIKSKIVGAEAVLEKYHVQPSQMVFLQALMGDSSDNIPGVSGIGPQTAAKLINKFGTLDEIYRNINSIHGKKIRENLIQQRGILDISLRLVTLERNVPLDWNLENFRISYDYNRVKNFLKNLGFQSLVRRLGPQSPCSEDCSRQMISTPEALRVFFELNRIKKLSFFFSSYPNGNNALALCCGDQTAICIFSANDNNNLFFRGTNLSEICRIMKPYLENPSIQKIGIRNELRFFKSIKLQSYDDLSVMNYLLHGTAGDTIGDVFRHSDDPICKLSFKNICETDQICKISELIYNSYEIIAEDLKRNQLDIIYQKVDRPLISILKNMEENGVIVSPQKLRKLAEEFSQKIKETEKRIFELVGYEFNIGSANQLTEALFMRLNIPRPKKRGSLDMESLEELVAYSPVPALVIEWRRLSKLLSTYTHSLCKFIDSQTGRIHSTFHMTSTITGRLSSSNPNLQNIPRATKYGRRIREAFLSEKGSQLVSFDYSQIELRVLAHVADIRLLKHAFIAKEDVHAITAASVFGLSTNNVTAEMRSYAKIINFGIIYGMSPFKLARIMSVPIDKAVSYINSYLEQFPEFEAFRKSTLAFVQKHGYVQTITKRRCYIKDILSPNYFLRQFGERQAVNATIQGSAADIVKIAMIDIFPQLKELHSKLLLQIHDELIFEINDEFVEQAIPVIKNAMENAQRLSVPLEANIKYNDSRSLDS
ncbi:MAG: DNA polymerase I [Holosporaceae bacterium]|jgi:DNA polymerase-1|nr:DNA polymerase I [Holosporaceae bacterium]